MTTSQLSNQQLSLPLTSGAPDGPAKTSATPTLTEKDSLGNAVGSSTHLWSLLRRFDLRGLSWKMSRGSYLQRKESLLRQLSTASKRSGIWGGGFRLTFSMRACPTTVTGCSLPQLLEATVPITSFLTAANCQGILRREKNADREAQMCPVFKRALEETLRLWSNVAEASGTPLQQASAPRYVPKLENIKEAIQTDRYYVARNLTWNECERLMGFPPGWTVVEDDSSETRSARSSPSGSGKE